jgi:hypothetical protein
MILWAERLLPTDLPQARILTFGYGADIVRVLKTASSTIVRDHGNVARNSSNALASALTNAVIVDPLHKRINYS